MILDKRPVFLTATETHQGCVRSNNEDEVRALIADSSKPWAWGVLVADGMGGGSAGELASRTVADLVEERIALWRVTDPAALGVRWSALFQKHLTGIVRDAHDALEHRAAGDPTLNGMGSTLALALAFHDQLVVVHCGDSRVYLSRRGQLTAMTRDHTWDEGERLKGEVGEEQIRNSPHYGKLLRVLGGGKPAVPDVSFATLEAGDIVLVCSDGLTKHVDDGVLAHLCGVRGSPEKLASALVKAAIEAGGTDNIAVGILAVRRKPVLQMPTAPRMATVARESAHARALVSSARRPSRRRRVALLATLLCATIALSTSAWLLASANPRRPSDRIAAGGPSLAPDPRVAGPASAEASASARLESVEGSTRLMGRRTTAGGRQRPSTSGDSPRPAVVAPTVAQGVAEASERERVLRESLDSAQRVSQAREAEALAAARAAATRAEAAQRELQQRIQADARRELCELASRNERAAATGVEQGAMRLKVWDQKTGRLDVEKLVRVRDSEGDAANRMQRAGHMVAALRRDSVARFAQGLLDRHARADSLETVKLKACEGTQPER